jgi:two-component system, OmpR family, response regulator
MRFLPTARIVVLDGDARRRALVCAELTELGLTRVVPAGSVKEARRLAAEQALDLCVVDPRAFDPGSRTKVFPNPFHDDGTLTILLATDASVATLEAAAAAGYRAVIASPVVPRLLYRRIGSILQKSRRTARSGG